MLFIPSRPRIEIPTRCPRCGKFRVPARARNPQRFAPRWQRPRALVNLAGIQINSDGNRKIKSDGNLVVSDTGKTCCCSDGLASHQCVLCRDGVSYGEGLTVDVTGVVVPTSCCHYPVGSGAIIANSSVDGTYDVPGAWCGIGQFFSDGTSITKYDCIHGGTAAPHDNRNCDDDCGLADPFDVTNTNLGFTIVMGVFEVTQIGAFYVGSNQTAHAIGRYWYLYISSSFTSGQPFYQFFGLVLVSDWDCRNPVVFGNQWGACTTFLLWGGPTIANTMSGAMIGGGGSVTVTPYA